MKFRSGQRPQKLKKECKAVAALLQPSHTFRHRLRKNKKSKKMAEKKKSDRPN
jgi:hypothetical protein